MSTSTFHWLYLHTVSRIPVPHHRCHFPPEVRHPHCCLAYCTTPTWPPSPFPNPHLSLTARVTPVESGTSDHLPLLPRRAVPGPYPPADLFMTSPPPRLSWLGLPSSLLMGVSKVLAHTNALPVSFPRLSPQYFLSYDMLYICLFVICLPLLDSKLHAERDLPLFTAVSREPGTGPGSQQALSKYLLNEWICSGDAFFLSYYSEDVLL